MIQTYAPVGGSVYWDDVTVGPTAPGPSTLAAGSVSNGGTISIGPTNQVTTAGTFAQAPTGTLDIQIGNAPSTQIFGSVTAGGAATLAGTLEAETVYGYQPSLSDIFMPILYPSETGTFSGYALPAGAGYQFAGATTFTNVVLSTYPTTPLVATVNTGTVLQPAHTDMLGVNMYAGDHDAVTPETQQMLAAAGLTTFRIPGGSPADDWHFNVADYQGDPASVNFAQFLQAFEAIGGTGLATLDYGSASPQEAAAELAYVLGSPTDTTVLGPGIEWNDTTGQWQDVNWKTVGYWAALRGASPLATDDGLNFLRIDHPAPFAGMTYWEVGNEEYGSWEVDHHGTDGPGGVSTGTAHDPATYAAFAQQFATFADEITTTAGVPPISIGIDSGDPTGATDNDWTRDVLADELAIGFVPGFISDHSYMYSGDSENDEVLLNQTDADPASLSDWATRYGDYESILRQTLPAGQAAGVAIMATEYNSVWNHDGKQLTSLVNGLFIANSIGSLMTSGYQGAWVFDLRDYWVTFYSQSESLYGWREGGDWGLLGDPRIDTPPATAPYAPYPSYFAMQLASKIIQSGGEVVSASSNDTDLDTYAVLEPSGHLDLLVINTNPAADLTEQFDFSGFQPGGAAQVWQYGKVQDAAQSQTADGSSALANFDTTLGQSGGHFTYLFPAYSMTVLDLSPAAATPTIDWPTPAAITYGAALSGTQLDAAASSGGSPVAGTYVYDPPAGTVLGAGNHTLSVIFTPKDTTDYTTATASVILTVNPAELTIAASTLSKTYGQAVTLAGTGVTVIGLVNGDNVTGVTLTSAGSAATAAVSGSPYAIAPGAAVGTGLGNYRISYRDGILTVNKANALIQVSGYDVSFDGQSHTAMGTATGVLGEALSGLDLSGTMHANAGIYGIDRWTFIDTTGNYNDASGVVSTPGPDTIVGPVNLALSTLTVSPTAIASRGRATVILTARDSFGSQELGGGLAVKFSTKGRGRLSKPADNHDGTYTAVFTAGTARGAVTFGATIDKKRVLEKARLVVVGPSRRTRSAVSASPSLKSRFLVR